MQNLPITPQNWRRHLGDDHATKVEAWLTRLQDANRLAIHTFEDDSSYTLTSLGAKDFSHGLYPTIIPEQLEKNAVLFQAGIHGDVKREDVPLLSMSLIPSRRSGKSVQPFDSMGTGTTLGYLFNLESDQVTPPVVVRGMEVVRYTGYSNYNKRLYLYRDTVPDDLKPFYAPYMEHTDCPVKDNHGDYYLKKSTRQGEQNLLNAALRNPAHFNKVMDVIGQRYDASDHHRLSELIVAATPANVAAIVMPIGNQSTDVEVYPLADASEILLAALSGLAHLRLGKDLPVVSYTMGPLDKGRITYLARGEEELRALALKQIGIIQQDPDFIHDGNVPSRTDNIKQAVKELVEVDMDTPLAQQRVKTISEIVAKGSGYFSSSLQENSR